MKNDATCSYKAPLYVRVGWFVQELVIDNSDPSNQILKLSGLSVGEYVVSLTVTDREGLLNTTLVNVTVLPATDYPPTANAGSDQVGGGGGV